LTSKPGKVLRSRFQNGENWENQFLADYIPEFWRKLDSVGFEVTKEAFKCPESRSD
jgi:hypothetical protein